MGDPLQHAQSSARLFGGVPSDYLRIHTLMDSSKLFLADWRHRALLHNTFGIHLFEQFIGAAFNRDSDGMAVCTRTVVTQHIMEDLGAVPTPGEFLREMPIRHWMSKITNFVKKRMQAMTIDGDNTMEAYIHADIKWVNAKTELPEEDGEYLVTDASGAVFMAEYVKDDSDDSDDAAIVYWARKPLSPVIPVNNTINE